MLLSIIIVNYNVKYFLELCLQSAYTAIKNIEAEIIIVDNNSSDGSVSYIQQRFPQAVIINNNFNPGFGKANNQALAIAKGAYVIYLNPDTIIPEDCFSECISFLQKNKNAGAAGVQMIDGAGNFLPESKRAFPAPITSFFKLSGLSAAFPKSKLFNKYALGYLSKDEHHKVDVLAGAFIISTKKILQALHGFDEDFFMYGEDVDLSYRIQQLGFNNYYLAQPAIIHFKGESTGQDTTRYINNFYEAMNIFVRKHYGGAKKQLFTGLLNAAIFFRKSIKKASHTVSGKPTKGILTTGNKPVVIFYGPQQIQQALALQQFILKKNKNSKIILVDDYVKLEHVINDYKQPEIIFITGEISNKKIIEFIRIHNNKATYNFHVSGSNAVVGSNNKTTAGNIVLISNNNE